jgi:hypothetical protein
MDITLSEDEISQINSLSEEWNCSVDDAIHRLLINALSVREIIPKKPWFKFYLLGAPWREPSRSNFVANLRWRFRNTPHGIEEAFKYIDTVYDRIITKATGLLTFNALLSALLVWAFEHYNQNNWEHKVLFITLMLTFVSSFLMMFLMYTRWSKIGYENPGFDFNWSARVCMNRSIFMTIGLILSAFAISLGIFTFIYHERNLTVQGRQEARRTDVEPKQVELKPNPGLNAIVLREGLVSQRVHDTPGIDLGLSPTLAFVPLLAQPRSRREGPLSLRRPSPINSSSVRSQPSTSVR